MVLLMQGFFIISFEIPVFPAENIRMSAGKITAWPYYIVLVCMYCLSFMQFPVVKIWMINCPLLTFDINSVSPELFFWRWNIILKNARIGLPATCPQETVRYFALQLSSFIGKIGCFDQGGIFLRNTGTLFQQNPESSQEIICRTCAFCSFDEGEGTLSENVCKPTVLTVQLKLFLLRFKFLQMLNTSCEKKLFLVWC